MLPSSLSGLAASVNGSLSSDFIRVLRGLAKANREANRFCAQFDHAERVDVFGHVERSLFQRYLKKAANENGFVARSHQNSARTSNYVQVQAGVLALTASAVEQPGELPRNANFR